MNKTIGMFTLITMATLASYSAVASDWNNYKVTVTNATSHHVITPPVIVIHKRQFSLFEVATAASEGLAIQAETGNPSVLAAEAKSKLGVYNVITGSAVIVYGNKATYKFRAPRNAKISMSGMLASTNDAVTAVLGQSLPKKSVSYMAATYDVGSEDNNELCIDIPGPPCGGTNAANDTDGEGFISIHNGISGVGDLTPSHLDWRGATSIMTITRMD